MKIYVLQHANFAIQLAKFGRVTDIFIVNEWHREIFSMKVETLEQLWDWYLPKKDKLADELKVVCSGYRQYLEL